MLTAKEKKKILTKFSRHEKDTGSTDVQVALLTREITKLTEHLKKHRKDVHSRRGLLGMVARRKKYLEYLAKADPKGHKKLIKNLGLK